MMPLTCGVRFLSRSQVDPQVAAAEPWMPHEVDRPPPPATVAAALLPPPPDPAALPQPLLLLLPLPPLTPPLLPPPVPAFPGVFLFESPGGGPRDLPIGAPQSSLVTTVGGGASPHVPLEPPNLPSGLCNKQQYEY
jgi:hypothetical protein